MIGIIIFSNVVKAFEHILMAFENGILKEIIAKTQTHWILWKLAQITFLCKNSKAKKKLVYAELELN